MGLSTRGCRGSGGCGENYFNPMVQVLSGSSSIHSGTRSGGRGSGGFGKKCWRGIKAYDSPITQIP